MRVLDLFSGIGGFSLGLERAGMQTIAFAEVDDYCTRVLRKHWPNVPNLGDVRAITLTEGFAEVICGGFPCQDISKAGRQAGIEGKRSGLWSEYARIIGDVRPRFVIVENVTDLLGRGLDQVLGDMAALGYDAEWHCIPASYIGAPHRRDRIWIVANTTSERNGIQEKQISPRWNFSFNCTWWHTEPTVGRVADGVPNRVDRLKSLGNAIVPQIAEIIGRSLMSLETGINN